MKPYIETVPLLQMPRTVPEGIKIVSSKGADTFDPRPETQVLKWADHNYWIFEFIDNRAAVIVAYNWRGDMVRQWDMQNVSYVWDIKLDFDSNTVTFWGRGNESETFKLQDLALSERQNESINPPPAT